MRARIATSLPDAEVSQRDSFLRDSTWHDVTWTFAPTNVLEEEYPVRIRWDFIMPSRQRFTARRYAPLLEGAKELLSVIRRRALISQLPQRATTVAGYFHRLRKLLRWMDAEGLRRFSELDSAALLRFRGAIATGRRRTGTRVSPGTVQSYLNLFVYLYHFRNELTDGLSADLCPGQTTGELAGVHQSRSLIHHGPHTPDAIAVPLVQAATEWRPQSPGPFHIPTSTCLVYLLNRFARWIGLPDLDGKPWHLTTHQGRKTFARFAALRDRSAVFALAQHFGHRDYATTDRGYVGTDYALDREIHAEILEQSVAAWEHMLSVPTLGGRAGTEILAKRPQFRGVRMKAELKTYARMLVEAGLILGVCDYGYCVYRQEYSACRGNAAGPNPVNREPSSCARCKNFAVTIHHRPYWLEQVRRCEVLLNEPMLPTQTLKIVRERLGEAGAMLRSIDSSARKERRGQKTAQ